MTNDLEQRFILAKQGDKAAFEALYEELLKPVYRFILVRTRNKEVAEDLTHHIFLKALEALPGSTAKTTSPIAYFLTAARNTVIDHWRKKKDTLVTAPEEVFESKPDPLPTPDKVLMETEQLTEIYNAMADLNDEQREVLILKFINDQPNDVIAKIIGKSQDAVRQIQSRALKQLRLRLNTTK